MKKLFLLTCALYGCLAYGQNPFRPNIYFQNMNYYNVAAGIQDTSARYQVSAYTRYKFTDNGGTWNKAPNLFLNHIGYIDRISSFYSASYIYDNYSFYDRHTIYLGYSHELKLPKTHRLSFGVRGVFNFDYVKWDRLPEPGNPADRSLYFTPDLDLGIQYRVKGFTLGVSLKNVIGNRKKIYGEILLKNQRQLYGNVSYAFNIKNKVTIAPFALVYLERNFGFDLGLYLGFFDRAAVSYAFRLKEFRHVYTLNVRIYKGLRIALAADHSSIYKDVNADLMLGYNFARKAKK